jgi:FKBP-type peptidyl-prolyl cis-trans isomerase 2
MAIKEKDFVEIEFTGKISNTNEIFDTNIKADAEKANLNTKNIKPFVLSVGEKMLPEGLDKDLVGKDLNKEYTLDLSPENAFGKRNPQMVKMIPTKYFHEQKIDPVRGMQLALDGQLVKVLSSDKGRTLVDFNNPLAGKSVTYTYKINKIVTDQKEKIDALQEFLFRKIFDFKIDSNTIKFDVEKQFEPFVKMFAPKFNEILGLKVETNIITPKKEEENK